MSTQPYKCEACEVECTFDRAGKFPEDDKKDVTYGVAWRCPKCDEVSLDLCPLGPVEVEKDTRCLNCGAKGESGKDADEATPCPDCGMSKPEMLEFLHLNVPKEERTVEKAEAAFDVGLFRRGIAFLDLLLLDDPENAKLWEAKGTQYQILRLNEPSIRCYRRAVKAGAGPLIEIALACALSDSKDNDGATSIYDGIIERTNAKEAEPLAIAHANRGNIREAKGDVEGAIFDYEAAIDGDKGRVTHYQNYIRLFARKKKWPDALAIAERGLESVKEKSERAILLNEKARAYNEQEKAEEGLSAAEEALAISSEDTRALYMRGWALGMLGRVDEGVETIEKLLEIDPTSKDGKRALAMMQAGQAKATKPWWKFWG